MYTYDLFARVSGIVLHSIRTNAQILPFFFSCENESLGYVIVYIYIKLWSKNCMIVRLPVFFFCIFYRVKQTFLDCIISYSYTILPVVSKMHNFMKLYSNILWIFNIISPDFFIGSRYIMCYIIVYLTRKWTIFGIFKYWSNTQCTLIFKKMWFHSFFKKFSLASKPII